MRSLAEIKKTALQGTTISEAELDGRSHRQLFVVFRREYCRAAQAEGYALVDIGAALGGRTPSTISRLIRGS